MQLIGRTAKSTDEVYHLLDRHNQAQCLESNHEIVHIIMIDSWEPGMHLCNRCKFPPIYYESNRIFFTKPGKYWKQDA